MSVSDTITHIAIVEPNDWRVVTLGEALQDYARGSGPKLVYPATGPQEGYEWLQARFNSMVAAARTPAERDRLLCIGVQFNETKPDDIDPFVTPPRWVEDQFERAVVQAHRTVESAQNALQRATVGLARCRQNSASAKVNG